MEQRVRFVLKYDLQYFANDEGGEKTEEATAKKLEKAREDGKVAKSKDVPIALSLMILFLALKYFAEYLGNKLMEVYSFSIGLLADASKDEFTNNSAVEIIKYAMLRVILIAGPVMLAVVFIALLSNALQAKWKVSSKPLKPKFSGLNPISGFKRIFGKEKIFELIKAVLKLLILSYVVYDALKSEQGLLFDLYKIDLFSAVGLIGSIIISLGLKISVIFLIIAIVDFIYQKLKFRKDMRMSKQEVKDEYKQSEGDPKVKGQIKQRMMQASQRRMMQKLPEADVVITNPTHLAVALRYDKERDEAPVVIAKGADYLAEKIKSAARENNIEIVENKPLARMLYYNVDLDMQIPPELYQMVAEILAFVYGLH